MTIFYIPNLTQYLTNNCLTTINKQQIRSLLRQKLMVY